MFPRISSVFFFLLLFSSLVSSVQAKDYTTSYNATYVLQKNGDAAVTIHADITQLSSKTFVSQFYLSFPSSFTIANIKAIDKKGEAIVEKQDSARNTKLTVTFNSPDTEKNSKNSFDLSFTQRKLFSTSGSTWELLIPVIYDDQSSDYTVTVILPQGDKKKLSIAKPTPSQVTDAQIVWNNPPTKTIYALFGDSQYYSVNLSYTLKNNRLSPGYYDIAFPPDTAYQRIYVDSITPAPELAYLDTDGNYMGRYTILPQKELHVSFKGFVRVAATPSDSYRLYAREIAEKNKKELLAPKKYWIINSAPDKKLKIPPDIYSFVTNTLTYSYDRVNNDVTRMGASAALRFPKQAICMEFSDLFIALMRQHGFKARENEGYGFSDNSSLRPVSLISDMLHSWPEYYDAHKNTWIQVDPTWQNTSGIDYFNSLDVNHITFAIHGVDSVYPLPAGTYKTTDTKQVVVAIADTIPSEHVSVELTDTVSQQLVGDREYKGTVELTNTGNVFITSGELTPKSDHIVFSPKHIAIAALAPYEKKVFHFTYKAPNIQKKISDTVTYSLNSAKIVSKNSTIIPFHTFITQFEVAGSVSLTFIIILIVVIARSKKK